GLRKIREEPFHARANRKCARQFVRRQETNEASRSLVSEINPDLRRSTDGHKGGGTQATLLRQWRCVLPGLRRLPYLVAEIGRSFAVARYRAGENTGRRPGTSEGKVRYTLR